MSGGGDYEVGRTTKVGIRTSDHPIAQAAIMDEASSREFGLRVPSAVAAHDLSRRSTRCPCFAHGSWLMAHGYDARVK